MPAPTTIDEFIDLVRKSGVLEDRKLDAYLQKFRATSTLPSEPGKLAGHMVADGLLTNFQAEQFLLGKWRRFTIGKYKVLERLGSGGMGSVYLCEHKLMRRRVAVKVLPTAKADDPSSLERFYREARAVAALDHPNIVRAYDIDQDDKLHFLVMEYVDGASLQEIIKRAGPMDVLRACHYIRQSAMGLQHAHESAGLVHRDIKPGNVLVDRNGIVKVLDMGLARFFHDEEDVLTKKYDENVLGTADYLAPEQALDSHGVDIRADIYSLGATFYFCLTGRTPFTEGTVAQKLIWHQTRQPKPIKQIRPEVPDEVVAIVEKMMAKAPAERYQTPLEVADALLPFTQAPIGPPPDVEMPRLSLAATASTTGMPEPGTPAASLPSVLGPASPPPRKGWQVPPNSAGARPSSPSAAPTKPSNPSQPPRSVTAATPASTSRGAQATLQAGSAVAAPPVEPAPAEESVHWDQLGPDTDDLAAKADTAPRSTVKKASPSGRKANSGTKLGGGGPDLMRYWWVAVLAGGLLLLLGALLIWLIASALLTTRPTDHGQTPPAPVQQPPQKPTLKVSQSAPDGFRTVAEALRKAKAGDRIVLQDAVLKEALVVDGKQWKIARDVTLEAADDLKEPVVWKLPDKTKEKKVLVLNNLEGLTLKGITFDGEKRADDCLALTGRCPGLTIEDVTLRGFKRAGLLITNCAGASDRPVTLTRVRSVTQKDAEHAVLIELNKNVLEPKLNEHIRFRDCSFGGPTKVPVKYTPAEVKNVELPPWAKR